MSRADRTQRAAWIGLAVVVVVSVLAVAWRGLLLPAVVCAVLACLLTLVSTTGNLRA